MIKSAAIKKGDKIFSGKKHSEIIQKFFEEAGGFDPDDQQGFLTETGAFLNRAEAGKHAYACGQIKESTDYLISEMLVE